MVEVSPMRILVKLLKNIILGALSLAILGLGAALIFIERKTSEAEERVKSWKPGTCRILSVKAGTDNNFYIQCQYQIKGQTYLVKNQTPSLNPYFNAVGSRDGKVVVTLIDSRRQSHFYDFKQGGSVKFWYDPADPANSVLIPYAANLRPFFYIGIGYYVVLLLLVLFGRKKSNKNE